METDRGAEGTSRRWTRLLLTAVIGGSLVVLAATGFADRTGEDRVEAGFQRALVAFGLARALNGVISVVQGTEVAFEPAGVGVNLAPGQVLDPVNDLVEQFSWVMLASTTSFGVQRILLEIFAWPGVSVVLAILVVILSIALWRGRGWLARRRLWLLRLALFVAFARFLVPALAYVGETVHNVFIEPKYNEALSGLQVATGELGEMSGTASEESESDGLLGKFKQALDVDARMERYRDLAGRAVEQTIDLIVIFVFQTILLPLAFLWLAGLAYRALVRLWRGPPGTEVPTNMLSKS